MTHTASKFNYLPKIVKFIDTYSREKKKYLKTQDIAKKFPKLKERTVRNYLYELDDLGYLTSIRTKNLCLWRSAWRGNKNGVD